MDKAIQKIVKEIIEELYSGISVAEHHIESETVRWTKIIEKYLKEVENE